MRTLALCIPAWNAERFLGRLLESAAAQTRRFDEILVYDDASTDSTGAVAKRHGAAVVRSDVNRGPSHGKNELAQLSCCDWIHFHDADGALSSQFVERASRWIDDDCTDVVLFGTEDRDDETGASLGERVWDDVELRRDPVAYAIGTTITNCGIHRRATLLAAGGFDTNELTKYNEDQALHLRLALAGLRLRADPYIGVVIYRREGSMSSGHPIECARAQFEVMKCTAGAAGPRYAREIGERLWHLATVSASYSDWEYVRRCLSLAADLRYVVPVREPLLMRCAARVSPVGAIRARECYVRLFKPALRRGVRRTP